jgi:hypothetical protein
MTVQPQTIGLRQSATAGSDGPVTSLVIQPQGCLLLVPGSGPYLVAEHLTAALPVDGSVSVRFTFSTGDSVDTDMPMAPPASPVTGQPSPTDPNSGIPGPSSAPTAPPAVRNSQEC